MVIFLRKINKIFHPPFHFNNAAVNFTYAQKRLGAQLDSKLSFNEHINNETSKAAKSIELLCKSQPTLLRRSLLIIYTCVLIIYKFHKTSSWLWWCFYDQPSNPSFSKKNESLQHNAALTIRGAIKGSSCDKLYQKLGLEYLQQKRWTRLLCLLYKFLSTGQPSHVHNLLP